MRKSALVILMALFLSSPAFSFTFDSSGGYQDEGTKLYVKGTAKLQENNYSEALVFLTRAVKMRPDMAEAFHNLGFAYEKNGNTQNAIMAYERAINLNPNYASALNNLGYLLATSERDVVKGIALCQRAVDLQPNSANYRDSLGWALYKADRTNEAITQFTTALRINPNFTKSHFNMGLAELSANNFDKAASSFLNVVRLSPSNLKAHVSLGDCYEKLNDNVKALNHYRQALARATDSDPIKRHLERKVKALTVESKEHYFASAKKMQTKAGSKLQEFMNRRGKSGELGSQYLSNYTQPTNTIQETNTSFTPVSATAANSNPLFSPEAIRLRNERDTNTWSSSYSASSVHVTPAPRQITVAQERELERKYSLAKSYLDRGLINEAANELNTIINNAPETSMVSRQARNFLLKVTKQIDEKKNMKAGTHSDMGKDFFRSGQYQLAETEFRKALSLDPDSAETYKDLALLNYNQGKYQEAYEQSKRAIALNRTLKEAYVVLASLYAKKGRHEDAIRTLKMISEVSKRRDAVDELAEKMMVSLTGSY
ncbi:MAG: tetratricopeptide repeat protein [Candidatus Riflebacteria bacterium]|jgi:tetratricopeptide (TPR) repeat protein|nr:tetratricopeptide repeat protein [Candidatus Riflebacteria bacterium]MDD2624261.1 tetratricopeptide repeat protein [Candidatus Riflebacteria bacterium]MDD3378270.1 tetratricopeptide repeat protein [Candidatus Riflebacteria bacterium]NCB45455.1 tetratricopeptide repeat protein [bacterium]NLV95364.1 tetratricopeptide repeat protein [Candidatus Riflebacteria bacterium]